jgi:hypothetical protein
LVKIKLEKHIYPKIPRIFFEKKEKCTPKKKKNTKKTLVHLQYFLARNQAYLAILFCPLNLFALNKCFSKLKLFICKLIAHYDGWFLSCWAQLVGLAPPGSPAKKKLLDLQIPNQSPKCLFCQPTSPHQPRVF